MNSKMVSLASIIERVYRTTDFESIPWSDAAEDVMDCLRLIGVSQSFLDKTTNGQGDNPIPIIIENFRGELPLDMAVPGPCRVINLNSQGEIASFRTMTETQDLFYQSPTVTQQFNSSFSGSGTSLVPTSLNLKLDEIQAEIDAGLDQDAQFGLEDIVTDIKIAEGRIVTPGRYNQNFDARYKLNNNYMFTNFKNGFVEMSYRALPVDEFGMPMVPDEIRFIKAVEWYITARLDYKKWRHTRNAGDERVWNESEKQSNWYTQSARQKARVPSLDMMESIKRMLLRSIPKINEHQNGFRNTNSQERRRF